MKDISTNFTFQSSPLNANKIKVKKSNVIHHELIDYQKFLFYVVYFPITRPFYSYTPTELQLICYKPWIAAEELQESKLFLNRIDIWAQFYLISEVIIILATVFHKYCASPATWTHQKSKVRLPLQGSNPSSRNNSQQKKQGWTSAPFIYSFHCSHSMQTMSAGLLPLPKSYTRSYSF